MNLIQFCVLQAIAVGYFSDALKDSLHLKKPNGEPLQNCNRKVKITIQANSAYGNFQLMHARRQKWAYEKDA